MAVINVLEDEIGYRTGRGLEFKECLDQLAEELLSPDEKGVFKSFFTVIRWYLGPAAERYLARSGYKL